MNYSLIKHEQYRNHKEKEIERNVFSSQNLKTNLMGKNANNSKNLSNYNILLDSVETKNFSQDLTCDSNKKNEFVDKSLSDTFLENRNMKLKSI